MEKENNDIPSLGQGRAVHLVTCLSQACWKSVCKVRAGKRWRKQMASWFHGAGAEESPEASACGLEAAWFPGMKGQEKGLPWGTRSSLA